MSQEDDDLEGEERPGPHDDDPRPPPATVEQGPSFDQAERPIGEERHRDRPEPAPAGGANDEPRKLQAPRPRVVPKLRRKPEEPISESKLNSKHDRDGEDEPKGSLAELVRDDQPEQLLASARE